MEFNKVISSTIPPSKGLAVDLNVGGRHTPTEIFFESLISWTVKQCGEEEFITAKEDFFSTTGKVFYDDENYHSRMHYFVYYFIFDRTLEKLRNRTSLQTPFEAFLTEEEDPLIGGFTHSIFKVLNSQPQRLIVLDILSNEKFRIKRQEEETLKGIDKGIYFQGFIFHLSDSSILSKGLVFHPQRASSAIRQSIKNLRKKKDWSPANTIAKFARLQLKHSRLKHVDPRLIYTDTTT